MFERIHVHIGASKAASSALQAFLRINANQLNAHGILVADSRMDGASAVTGEHVWFFEDLVKHPSSGQSRLEQSIEHLSWLHPECHTLLLSAENLSNNNGASAFFSGLSSAVKLRVIMYLRRQDEFLISAWQQWFCKLHNDFEGWRRTAWDLGNWRSVCERWVAATSRDALQLAIYDDVARRPGGIFEHFQSAIGAPDGVALARPLGIVNPSLSDAVTDLVAGKTRLFRDIHDNRFYNMISALTADKFRKKNGITKYNLELRQNILRDYQEVNAWVKQKFFPGLDRDTLFPPIAEPERVLTEHELQEEGREIVLVTMLALFERVRNLERRLDRGDGGVGKPEKVSTASGGA